MKVPFNRLTEAKMRKARQGVDPSPESGEAHIPPGQRRVEKLPVLDLGIQPGIDVADWRLEILGAVKRARSFDWEQLRELPIHEVVADIHCVTRWSMLDVAWRVVRPRDLFEACGVLPEATHVTLRGYDDYTTNLPLEALRDDDVLIAFELQGRPLPRQHGGPVRLVVPKRYFWKSAKWLRAIEVHVGDRPGFWEVRGYHNDADPWKEERFG